MEISINRTGDSARVVIKGHIDEKGAEDLKTNFQDLVSWKIKDLLFDFKDVTRIGSAGIGQILLAYKTVAMNGGRLRVENLSPTLYDLFQGLKLDTLFVISR